MSVLRKSVWIVAVLAALTFFVACGDDDDTTSDTTTSVDTTAGDTSTSVDDTAPDVSGFEGALVGTFSIDAGECQSDTVTGSSFRMVQPGGTLEEGPFVPNGDSPCTDQTWNPLMAGTDGGLDTTTAQTAPDPAFDETGNGLAAAVIEPVVFFGVAFAVAVDAPAPALEATDGSISGDTSGWTAYYGNEMFNQGAPKPDGSTPGLTAAPTGTIDPETGAYVLEWSSQIVGGAFNDFTGIWHLEGTFTPAG